MKRLLFVLVLAAGGVHGVPTAAQDQMPELTPIQNKAAKLAGLAGFVNLS